MNIKLIQTIYNMEQTNDCIEKIKIINQAISEALRRWSNIVITADADEWAYFLEQSDEDMLNALFIFNHVWQNRAIKEGIFNPENATEKMEKFKSTVMDIFGVDTIKLTNKVVSKIKGENKNGSEDCKNG